MGQRLSPIKTPKATYAHAYVAFGVFCLKNLKKGEKNGTGKVYENP